MTLQVARPTSFGHGDELLGAPLDLVRRRTFHTLDALRGVAAVSVLLVHAAFFYGIAKPAEGQLAVDLFFVMSGFIVAQRYEPDLRRGMSIGQFARIRLVRLYPLFLLGMVLGVVPALIMMTGGHADALHKALVASFPLALVMLPSPFALPNLSELYPLNYVAWSLALELVINIAYAASFRVWTIRNLTLVLGAAFIGLCLSVALNGRLDAGYAWQQAYVGCFRVLYGFSAGIVLYRIYERKPFGTRLPWWLALLLATVLFFAGAGRERGPWELFAITAAIPAIVAIAIASEPPKSLRPLCALAGLLSYPVYSLHAPFIGFFMRGESLAHLSTQVQTHLEALIFTVLLVGLCVVAQFLYDRPVRRFLTTRRIVLQSPSRRFSTVAARASR